MQAIGCRVIDLILSEPQIMGHHVTELNHGNSGERIQHVSLSTGSRLEEPSSKCSNFVGEKSTGMWTYVYPQRRMVTPSRLAGFSMVAVAHM